VVGLEHSRQVIGAHLSLCGSDTKEVWVSAFAISLLMDSKQE
jgi:hypothetical protein